jgi:hypothetical protein
VTWNPINVAAFMAGFAIVEAAAVTVLALLVGVALIRKLLRVAGW